MERGDTDMDEWICNAGN